LNFESFDQWFEKMQEYLKMDDEISFEEFTEYAQGFFAFLGEHYEKFDNDVSIKARFMCSILQSNADARSKRKSPTSKKFKKLAEKSGVWLDAITYRLGKNGMSRLEIDKATQELSDSLD
jgi:hypothetical protein